MSHPNEHPLEVTTDDVHRAMAAADPPLLLDCRTAGERETASIDPSIHVPMDELGPRFEELQAVVPASGVVVYCHHGVRSLRVTHALRRAGMDAVSSMSGGIDAWSVAIDPLIPRY
ncbi:MAG: rhodanese-like domain-containing protein [Phycisphaerales bacterium]